MAKSRRYGPVDGTAVGAVFPNRAALRAAGLHLPMVAGISGDRYGADSVVVSGGYEDDQDSGDEIIYTGQGGNASSTRRQIADQSWTRGNAGLVRSALEGFPVRVIRGAHKGNPYAPPSGYRYDGLYFIQDFWESVGKSGFRICRFKLVRDDPSPRPWPQPIPGSGEKVPPPRQETTIQRIIRNTAVATEVKNLHNYTCQVCGVRLETPGGPYAEGAHIRALGAPHHGPDRADNLLCLCPNHHVLFDSGALVVFDDLSLGGHPGKLRTVSDHPIDHAQLAYHRAHSLKRSDLG